jgi:hypothetical protein
MDTTGTAVNQPQAQQIEESASDTNVAETTEKMLGLIEEDEGTATDSISVSGNEPEEGPIDSDEQLEGPIEDDDPISPLIDIGGEKKTAQEWKDGYMKAQDYTRKTQELAAKRKELEAKDQRTSQMQEAYAATLGLLTRAAKDEVSKYHNVDWKRMAAEAPTEYIRHQAEYQDALQNLKQTEAEAVEFFGEVKQGLEEKEYHKAHYAKQELVSTFRGWTNDLYYSLIDYGVHTGMDRGELMRATDPNLFKTLYKARLYDYGKGVNTQPKSAGRASQSMNNRGISGKGASSTQNAMNRLKQTGDVDAAQDVMLAFV